MGDDLEITDDPQETPEDPAVSEPDDDEILFSLVGEEDEPAADPAVEPEPKPKDEEVAPNVLKRLEDSQQFIGTLKQENAQIRQQLAYLQSLQQQPPPQQTFPDQEPEYVDPRVQGHEQYIQTELVQKAQNIMGQFDAQHPGILGDATTNARLWAVLYNQYGINPNVPPTPAIVASLPNLLEAAFMLACPDRAADELVKRRVQEKRKAMNQQQPQGEKIGVAPGLPKENPKGFPAGNVGRDPEQFTNPQAARRLRELLNR
jgi:hypothetical protein